MVEFARANFELFTSEVTLVEASKGDAAAAARRLQELQDLLLLRTTNECENLAAELIIVSQLPPHASVDALHIAIATIHKIDFLATWNCTHIANGVMQLKMRSVTERHGLTLPVLCTPFELQTGEEL